MAKYSRTVGADKNFTQSGRVVKYGGIYLAYVKDNKDAQRMGRLRVWVPEFGSRPDDEGGWVTVSYVSPFAGATNPDLLGNNIQVAGQSQTSYGWWAVPPDLGNQVVITFINSDPTRGVWLGCLFQQYMNNMVPGIPAGPNYQSSDHSLPVSEYNKKTTENVHDNMKRPELASISEGIAAQGLASDTIRGVTSSGARRETPSTVYGLLTPGPADTSQPQSTQGVKRLGGTQFYFDDGDGSEHFRVRTRSGAQLLIDETNGIVYAMNRKGTSWIQMDEDGNVDIFGAQSVSVRAQEDINYRADRDVNIEAGRNINIKAAKTYSSNTTGSVGGVGSGSGGSVVIEAQGDYERTVIGNSHLTVGGTLDIKSSKTATLQLSKLGINASNLQLDTGGNLNATGNVIADGDVYGSDVHGSAASLNEMNGHFHTDPQGGVTGPYSATGGSSSASGPSAASASTIATVSKTNVLSTFSDAPDNFIRDTQSVVTVVGRFLTYEPCPEHIKKG